VIWHLASVSSSSGQMNACSTPPTSGSAVAALAVSTPLHPVPARRTGNVSVGMYIFDTFKQLLGLVTGSPRLTWKRSVSFAVCMCKQLSPCSGGYIFLIVCLSVSNFMQKVANGFA